MPVANDPRSLHIDRYLTDLSVGFMQSNDRFVADKVFPPVPVDKASDKYVIFDRADLWRDQMRARPLGGRPGQLRFRFSDDSYSVEEFAVEYVRDDRIVANQDDPLASDRQAMRVLTSQAAVSADNLWASTYFQTGVWTTEKDGATAAFIQWDLANSDPIEDVAGWADEIDALTGQMPNVGVIGVDAYRVLKNHAEVIDRIKHVQPGFPTQALLAEAMGLDRLLVARGIKTTSAEGATTATFQRVANAESFLLVHAPDAPALDTPSAGYTFAWTGLLPGATNILGGVIERGRDERAHSDFFQIRRAFDYKVVSADLGLFAFDILS